MRLSRLAAASLAFLCALPTAAVESPIPAPARGIAFRSVQVPVRPQSFDAVCRDFNGDGKADLAITHPKLASASVCLGNGDGSFKPCSDLGHIGKNLRGLGSGDFNRDGAFDLAAGSS